MLLCRNEKQTIIFEKNMCFNQVSFTPCRSNKSANPKYLFGLFPIIFAEWLFLYLLLLFFLPLPLSSQQHCRALYRFGPVSDDRLNLQANISNNIASWQTLRSGSPDLRDQECLLCGCFGLTMQHAPRHPQMLWVLCRFGGCQSGSCSNSPK